MLRLLVTSAITMALLAATPAWAASNDEDNEAAATQNVEAKRRFLEGNERYAHGDYEGASQSFRAAIAADPKLPGPYRNLGLCYRALNRCGDALPMYEKYLQLKPESRFTERVRQEIDLCRQKLGQAAPAEAPLPPPPVEAAPSTGEHAPQAQGILHVSANLIGGEATDEATVKVDGLVRGATPLTIPVTAGKHKVTLSRLGFESGESTIVVGPGERNDVELTLNKLAVAPLPPVVSQTSTPLGNTAAAPLSGPVKTGKSLKPVGWALLGVAGALAAVGAGFGIEESKIHRDVGAADHATTTRQYIDSQRDKGQKYGYISDAALAAGGAALLAASIVLIIDPTRGEQHPTQKYVIAPTVGPSGGSLVATVRF